MILLEILSSVTNVKLENDSSSVIYCLVIFDQKAISPGAERYSGSLYGVSPSINGQTASDLCSNGYQKMLSDRIKHFKENRIKQGEFFMIQLLMVVVPIAVYHLLQSSSHEDIAERLKKVLIYASTCSCCLQEAMQSQRTPQCNYFCRDCFTCQTVCERHERIYSDWNCDRQPCEECNHKIQIKKEDVRCIRFRILSSISDQDPAYQKFGQEISISLEDFLNGLVSLTFHYFVFMT